jgi:DNA polymerase-4/protein ImuB
MKIACVLTTHLPIKVELKRYPELVGKPALIMKELGSQRLVLDYSAQARGIVPGMPVQQAVAVCKDVMLLESDESHYQAAFDDMLDALEQRGPLVEASDLGCAYVGLDGLEMMYGGEARLITSLLRAVHPVYNPRVGVAQGKFPAYIAAVTSPSGQATKVPDKAPEDVADFLEQCSINLLPISWENKARLLHFGLTTLGHVAAQPVGAMQAQFGPEGLKAWELAQGIDRRALIPRPSDPVITEYLTFPDPSITLPGILLAIESLLLRAFSRTEVRGKYARSVKIESQILHHPPWVKTFNYKQAVSSKDSALAVIQNALESVALPGPLEDMQLTLTGLTGESGIQASLFSDVRKQEQLREIIRQLRVRWGGQTPIYLARDLEPWSPIPERRKILVPFDY